MKVCTQCNLEKNDDEYYFRDKKNNVRCTECMVCSKARGTRYYQANREHAIKVVKKYRDEHKNAILENKKEYYKNNKKRISQWQADNKDKLQKITNKRRQERRKNDPSFKLRTYVSNRIRDILKGRKNGATWQNLCYTPQQLKAHLEQQFEPWMTWQNWGKYDPKTWDDNDPTTWTWQIDHIIPQSSFQYLSIRDQAYKDCWALGNLRPFSSKQNIIDGSSRSRHK